MCCAEKLRFFRGKYTRMSQPCDTINALADFQLDVIAKLNKKLVALQHLAQLLEQLGDAAVQFVNDLSAFVEHLVPIVDIDFSVYLQIKSACPFINLPPLGSEAGVSTAALQAMVSQAYNNMLKKLLNHPYTRMGSLQGQLDSYLNQVDAGAAVASAAYQCLLAACNGQLFQPSVAVNANTPLGQYQKNFVVGGGKVLDPAAAAKFAQVQNLTMKLRALGATAGGTYAAAKFKITAAQTPTGSFNNGLNYGFVDAGSNNVVVAGTSLNDRGTWSPSTPYSEFDVVSFNGVLYMALESSTDLPPNG